MFIGLRKGAKSGSGIGFFRYFDIDERKPRISLAPNPSPNMAEGDNLTSGTTNSRIT